MRRGLLSLTIFGAGLTAFAGEPGNLDRFVSDGCTVPRAWTAIDYTTCCVRHDFAYWVGGTLADKDRADAGLINCIRSLGATEFTAGTWQIMLANFGQFRWGSKWTPRRNNEPLTKAEWAIVQDKARDFRSVIPIVRSYRSKSVCPKSVLTILSVRTTLAKPSEVVCYDLVEGANHSGKLIYSVECNLGYFVYQLHGTRMPSEAKARDSLDGYGLCADKIPPERKSARAPEIYYKTAPLPNDAAPTAQ